MEKTLFERTCSHNEPAWSSIHKHSQSVIHSWVGYALVLKSFFFKNFKTLLWKCKGSLLISQMLCYFTLFMLFEVSKWGVETDSTVFCARVCDPSADVNETDRLNEAAERNQNLTLYVAPSRMSCRKQINRKKIKNSETLYVCDR